MSYYKNHIFICTNQKDNNKKCCANGGAQEMLAYAKEVAAKYKLSKENGFRISSSGCMGRCEEGPALVVYPQGRWCMYKNKEDIDCIIKEIADQTDILSV